MKFNIILAKNFQDSDTVRVYSVRIGAVEGVIDKNLKIVVKFNFLLFCDATSVFRIRIFLYV